MQQQQIRRPWRATTYRIAKWAWILGAWMWSTVLIAFLVQFVPNLLTTRTDDLQQTWASAAIQFLRSSSSNRPLEILRLAALGLVFLLIAIPPLAFGLKQMLRNIEPKAGIDKIIEALEQDTFSPQLDLLQRLLEHQLQKLETCVQTLGNLSDLLQQAPTASNLLMLYVLSQQQHALQEEQLRKLEACVQALGNISSLLQQTPTASDLLGLQKEFSQILRDIQERTLDQAQWSADLYEQSCDRQEKVSGDFAKIALLLAQLQESLKVLALPCHRENGYLSDKEAIMELASMIMPPTSMNGQE